MTRSDLALARGATTSDEEARAFLTWMGDITALLVAVDLAQRSIAVVRFELNFTSATRQQVPRVLMSTAVETNTIGDDMSADSRRHRQVFTRKALDHRPLLLVSRAASFGSDVGHFVDSLKLGLLVKFKERVGLVSATSDVLRAATDLERSVDGARNAMLGDGDPFVSPSLGELRRVTDKVIHDGKNLIAKLQAWLSRHDRDGNRSGADGEMVRSFRDALTQVNDLVEDLGSNADESAIKTKFLSCALPPGFPIDDVPRLRSLILEHASAQVVKAAKSPDSFLRDAEVAAYASAMRWFVTSHFLNQIAAARERNGRHALAELKNDPALLGLATEKLLENATVRANVAHEYQALITSMLGATTASAKEAAEALPDSAIEMTGELKDALDGAVLDGKLTPEEAANATRALVVNNFLLRSFNPAFVADYGHSDPALNTHVMNRGYGVSLLLQQHASGLDLSEKQPALADLEMKLVTEKAKVHAFIDAAVARL